MADEARSTSLGELQARIAATYGARDSDRGLARLHAWFVEECGELSRALFRQGHEEQLHEFGDVLAWLATLANEVGVDLDEAVAAYADGCPKCTTSPCTC